MRLLKNGVVILLIAAADAGALLLCMLLAFGIRIALEPFHFTPRFNQPLGAYLALYWVPLLALASILFEHLYDRRMVFWEEAGRMLKACLLSGAVVLAILTLSKTGTQYSRLLLTIYVMLTVIVLPMVRLATKWLLATMGLWRRWAVVIGCGETAKDAALGLDRETHLGYRVVGFIDEQGTGTADSIRINGSCYPVFESLAGAAAVVPGGRVDLVVLAESNPDKDRMTRVRELQQQFPAVMIAPDMAGVPLLNAHPLRLFREQRLLLDIQNNLASPMNRILKWIMDMVLTILSTPIWLSAVAIMGLLIKLTSRGPVFFVQERLGRNGQRFRLLKFRTMYVDADRILADYFEAEPERKAEWETYRKLRGRDPRVTGVGRFLRRTSLDELPQLFNVLTGRMSLVGPRPYMPEEKRNMSDSTAIILAARPGLTGLWQTSGRNRLTFRDRVNLDRWYVMNWTLWLDVEILVKTFRSVLRRDGAF